MSISAVCLRNLYLEKCSGITARFRLIWEDELICYCFFWGIAAVVWFKILFPPVEKWIEKIPAVAGKILTWVLLGFMVCNILVSCVALVRYDERGNGVQATNAVQKWADAHYDDAKMKKIYPNAKGIN